MISRPKASNFQMPQQRVLSPEDLRASAYHPPSSAFPPLLRTPRAREVLNRDDAVTDHLKHRALRAARLAVVRLQMPLDVVLAPPTARGREGAAGLAIRADEAVERAIGDLVWLVMDLLVPRGCCAHFAGGRGEGN